ncbi:MAG TPA: DUF4340 domain-containing protein [Planctomycetaceae bacterium]|nr:DUF4340 domain-containing protein [Planctomycetaceae bacterium]
MNEIQRTLTFAVTAVVSLGLAWVAAPGTPRPLKEFQEVNQEFYPDFKDADAAKQLDVIAYNPDTAEARVFGITFKDGLWRIPSRYNYPVDGKDRLAKCAASVMQLKREGLAGQRASQHAEFEVVDPLDESSESLKRGQRITLKDEKGTVLADYIIGKEVPNRSGYYYIRKPKEPATYIAKVELQLSTKFADWIEPDLLKLDGMKLNGVTVDSYTVVIDRGRGKITGRQQNVLKRKDSSSNWTMEGLDEKEEVNQDEVRKLVNALDELKIVGIRPKPIKLQRDLRLDSGIKLDENIALDLETKGYFFAPTPEGGLQLFSKEGDVIASTNEGVEYLLHFGEVFSGSEEEIEFGFAKSDDAAKTDEKKDDADAKKDTADGKKKSRYLFVTTQLNAEAIGPKPEAPTKPEEPGEAPKVDVPERTEDSPASADQPENVGPLAEYNEKKRAYDAALAKYESDKTKFEADEKSYEQKSKDGEKKVKELNDRFANWYYVISADSFENLRQGRKTLVKEKGAEKPAGGADAGGLPPGFNFGAPPK